MIFIYNPLCFLYSVNGGLFFSITSFVFSVAQLSFWELSPNNINWLYSMFLSDHLH